MGTQQILMIILSVIVVGTAIAAGIQMFDKQYESQTKMAMANEVLRAMSMCRAYYRTPVAMGGGGNGKDSAGDPLPVDVLKMAKYVNNSAELDGGYAVYRYEIGYVTFLVYDVNWVKITHRTHDEKWQAVLDFDITGNTPPNQIQISNN